MKDYLFTSERLGFRGWTADDLEKMHLINSDAEVMEYFPATLQREQTKAFIDRMQIMLEEKGYCYFAVEEKESGNFIGFIGLFYQEYIAPFTPYTDVGWRLAKKFWGKGYATEGAKRCIEYAFINLKLTSIKATAPRVNIRSIKVMEKSGMRFHSEFVHPRLENNLILRDCVCYEIKKDEEN